MDITATEWNQRFGVGTAVHYHPVIGGKEFIATRTCSQAWEICGEAVVKIEGAIGSVVSLEAIDVIAQ